MNYLQWTDIMDVIATDIENEKYEDIHKLRDYLNTVIDERSKKRLFENEYLESKKDILTADITFYIKDMSDDIGIQTFLKKTFKYNNINCLAELIQYRASEFAKIRNIGTKRFTIVSDFLAKCGLAFGIELTDVERIKIARVVTKIKKQREYSENKSKKSNNVKVYGTLKRTV